jgi:hypothetical protein
MAKLLLKVIWLMNPFIHPPFAIIKFTIQDSPKKRKPPEDDFQKNKTKLFLFFKVIVVA